MRLKDKVAIITAAGSGSGRAGALIFAREGAKVVGGDISSTAGQETVDMVKKAGGEATFVQVDVGKVEDMRRLIDTTVKAYGKINILWNHAGIPGPGLIEDTEEDAFDKAIRVNIKGGFFATKFVIPHMKKAGSGSIIFTASVAALRASPWSPSYSLAKGGLIPFTMSLAVYLGPHNIRANCICPGGIDSPMLRVFVDRTGSMKEDVKENTIKEVMKKNPIPRLATPEDIANAALFLASDEASYINGAILPVDGGLIARIM
jgi:NAD(P)-dependent dehydrogenase (short-subunit alcohol dehydrogenase family)